MRHFVGRSASLGLVLAALCLAPGAQAQYRYPAGYGGWGGWGGPTTVAGSNAMGMGAFAAGAGAYNEQTAQARSVNANTAMQMNEYMYAVRNQNAKTYYARQAKRAEQTKQSGEAIYKRIHDDPSPRDIHVGDALNAVLDDLTGPQAFPRALQEGGTQPIPSALVQQIEFQYAAQMITESLGDLAVGGAPDILQTSPLFESDRKTIRALVAAGRKQLADEGRIEPETLAKLREAITAARQKVERNFAQGTPNRIESENYLKALFGLTKMLQTPDIAKFLSELKTIPTTNLGQLLAFMHSFNLRFGPAKTGPQQAAYDQLFPLLTSLRDQIKAPATNPFGVETKPDPSKVTGFFSGMDYSHFGPQPDPHGATPPPPAPR